MADAAALIALDERIAAIRENIRTLTEQAAGFSGAGDEDRAADRMAEQERQLAELLKEREALAK
jgi:hypothetical protein